MGSECVFGQLLGLFTGVQNFGQGEVNADISNL